jgi:hypothetical protein
MSEIKRASSILLPLLRAGLGDSVSKVGTWTENIDYRTFPLVNIRRVGGPGRNPKRPKKISHALIELCVYGIDTLDATEQIYEDALEALFDAVLHQTVTPAGYLHSMREHMAMEEMTSPFEDSWRVQGLILVGIRPPWIISSHL